MTEENNEHRDSTAEPTSRAATARGGTSRSSYARRSRSSYRSRGRSRRRRQTTICGPGCIGFKGATISYKQIDVIQQFVTDRGKIRPRRQTGTCAKHQRVLAREIKRARHMALLPFTGTHFFPSGGRG